MKTKLSILVGSLAGACAIHLVLTACGGGHGSITQDAGAQTTPACTSWKPAIFFYDVTADYANIPPNKILEAPAIPEGWEPVNAVPWGGDTKSVRVQVALRKCASP